MMNLLLFIIIVKIKVNAKTIFLCHFLCPPQCWLAAETGSGLTWFIIRQLTDSRPAVVRRDAENLREHVTLNCDSQRNITIIRKSLTVHIFCSCSNTSVTPGNAGAPCSISTKMHPAPLTQTHKLLKQTCRLKRRLVYVWFRSVSADHMSRAVE